MFRYYVLCGGAVVHRTDNPREAHREARRFTRDKQMAAFVTRAVCSWTMEAVRRNA
jgi:hypothetical protein